jgi:hypothetical protein
MCESVCVRRVCVQSLSRVDIASAVASHRALPHDRVHAKPRPPGGAVRSPLDITMDSTRLRTASGVTMRPLARMLDDAFADAEPAKRQRWHGSYVLLLVGVLSAAVAVVAMSYVR